MDLLSGMRVFTHVVEAGGFTAASQRLGLSRAAVSKQVAQLEGHLGGQLLQRTTRRVSLTEIGQAFYTRCKAILEDVAEAESLVTGLSAEPRGTLRLNVPMTFGVRQIAPLLGRFTAMYPRLQLELSFNDRMIDLVEEGYDLAIRIATLQDSNLVARRLAASRTAICAAPAYLEQHGMPRAPADLRRHRCLRYQYAPNSNAWTLTWDGHTEQVRVGGPLLLNNGDALCMAAEHGAGIVMLPSFIVGDAIRAGRLVRVMHDYDGPTAGIHAVYASSRHLTAKVRTLIDFLAAEIHDPPPWDAGIFEP